MARSCRRCRTAEISVPVVHQGELLGAISITMPKDEPLRPAGEQLVTDVASQAGLALANAGLIEDLRASRQRLVTAQDEARRRLERNIHDGAQQDLVALAIKLQLAETTVAADPAQTGPVFGDLKAGAAGALENLRDLARGIYPPLLADLGLAAALNAQASKSPLPVTVEADGIGRFGQDTEAAVYFCCLEALQNTAKYAHATQARICLQAHNGTLQFTVSDDGTGYDTRHTPTGLGPAEHGRPPRRTRRPARDPVRSQPRHHHHRASPGPGHQQRHQRAALTPRRGHYGLNQAKRDWQGSRGRGARSLTWELMCALGGTRTPSLLIRSEIQEVRVVLDRRPALLLAHMEGDRFQSRPRSSRSMVRESVSKIGSLPV